MQSVMIRFLMSVIAFVSAVLVADMAVATRALSPVGQVFAKHGVSWESLRNYREGYTVQRILHRFFTNDPETVPTKIDGRRVLDYLGFHRGVIPTDTMLASLQQAVENDPEIINDKDWQEPLRRLAISTRAERVLSEIDETVVATDESLSSWQQASLKRFLALRDSYVANTPVTIDNAIEAVKKADRLALTGMLDSGELDPNLPIDDGMPLLGLVVRMISRQEGELERLTNLFTAGSHSIRIIKEELDNSINLLKWLVDHPRVDINAIDRQGRTFIGMAAWQGSFEALKIALSKGMNINYVDWLGNSPLLTLMIFVSGGASLERVKFLVEEHNARIDIINNDGVTAIQSAVAIEAKWGGTEVTEYLLDQGADVNVRHSWKSPLGYAIALGKNHDLIDLLRKRGAKDQ